MYVMRFVVNIRRLIFHQVNSFSFLFCNFDLQRNSRVEWLMLSLERNFSCVIDNIRTYLSQKYYLENRRRLS